MRGWAWARRHQQAAALALLLAAAALLQQVAGQAIQDSRCYLTSGGAVESFYISEATRPGTVIGTLSVNGDARAVEGTISLTLQERDAPVAIVPGTKNITLLRELDREEKRGPSNVYVNVRCDRRRTTDPSFVIPLSVRVWDANDNAPAWRGSPFALRLSELTGVGSRVASLRADDADQPGPHATVHYTVAPGSHQQFFEFPNELEGNLVLRQPLDFESLRNFSVTLRASDGGLPPLYNDTTLEVTVLDADDQNPKFTYQHYTAQMPLKGKILQTSPGPISAYDQDVGINAPILYSITGDNSVLLSINNETGVITLADSVRDIITPVTIVIKATQVDNPDRYALATLGLSGANGVSGPSSGSGISGLSGVNGVGGARGSSGASGFAGSGPAVRFARHEHAAAVAEDTPVGSTILTLRTVPDASALPSGLQFFVSDRGFLERFGINSAGDVVLRKPLDYETQDQYHYQVMLTDGRANDTASLNITVLDVNEWEPRFRHPHYEFRVEEEAGEGAEGQAEGLLRVGRLEAFDGDRQDKLTLTLHGTHAHLLRLQESGELLLPLAALRLHNETALHVVATARDSGQPARQSSVPVVVHIPPRPDAGVSAARGGAAVALVATALALLALLVLALALMAYICSVRRRAKPSPNASPPESKSHGFRSHNTVGLPPSVGERAGLGQSALGSSGSLLSVSAGASTILANSSSSLDLRGDSLAQDAGVRVASVGRQSQRFPGRSKVSPAPLPPLSQLSPGAGGANGTSGANGVAALADHLGGASGAGGRSGVAWPASTIPATVKKLSWDDTQNSGGGEATARVHDATNSALGDHMNLTVYF